MRWNALLAASGCKSEARESNLDSIVIRRLKEEEPAFPFFS